MFSTNRCVAVFLVVSLYSGNVRLCYVSIFFWLLVLVDVAISAGAYVFACIVRFVFCLVLF